LLAPLRAMLPPLMASPAEPVRTEVNVLTPPTLWAVVKSTKFWVDEPVPPLAMERVPEERLPSASEETAPAPRTDSLTAPLAVILPVDPILKRLPAT